MEDASRTVSKPSNDRLGEKEYDETEDGFECEEKEAEKDCVIFASVEPPDDRHTSHNRQRMCRAGLLIMSPQAV